MSTKFKNKPNQLTGVTLRIAVTFWGKGSEKRAGMFYFLIQAVVTQVFSFCGTSLGSTFMIHALFCICIILQKKKKRVRFT